MVIATKRNWQVLLSTWLTTVGAEVCQTRNSLNIIVEFSL